MFISLNISHCTTAECLLVRKNLGEIQEEGK